MAKLTKKKYERKLREEEEATAHVFQDFLTSFQGEGSTSSKVFIKAAILNSDHATSTTDLPENQIYAPKPILVNKKATLKKAIECAKILNDTKLVKNKNKRKTLSNLELLKEEIKQRQSQKGDFSSTSLVTQGGGYDPCSTNLFVANLNPKINEETLMMLFGSFGALASVKIMWPRGEEKTRNLPTTNCGFVAFMSRKDAERALRNLEHRSDMRITWGRGVELPPQPIYIPPTLTKMYLPPPYSGLPFNAQPINVPFKKPTNEEELEHLLSESVVRVTIPLDRKILCIIHRVIEFVIKEGPLFEAMIIINEGNNPDFSFLIDNKSPMHVYYRWKLFSILNGDGQKLWSSKPFRMFKNGPVWIPPVTIDYRAGMPDHLIAAEEETTTLLSDNQCLNLIKLIRDIDMNRGKIFFVMQFCLNHRDAITNCISLIFESLKNTSTTALKKIARLYLLSDVFWNCRKKCVKINESEVAEKLKDIFQDLRLAHSKLNFEIDKHHFKTRIFAVLRSWKSSHLFSNRLVEKLGQIFIEINEDDDFISDEPLDGANLLKRTLINTTLSNDVDIPQKRVKNEVDTHFINSSWNRVDPNVLQSQAMSSQKLYEMALNDCSAIKDRMQKNRNGHDITVSSKWDYSDSD